MSLHTAADADRVLATRLADVADLRHLPWEIVPVRHLTSSLSPRKRREDPEHVRLLAETDRALDPLLVHRPTMRVIDGMHRLRAAVLKGRSEIAVRFFDGSEADAFVLSVRLNVGHGLPLTLDERKEAARRILASHPHWSDRAVAESTGLSAKTVATVRRRLDGQEGLQHSRVGRDGRSRPLSSIEGRRSAAALLAANSEISLRELSRKTGLSVGTVRDVRERLGRGQDPIPERLRARERSGAGPRGTTTPARDQDAEARRVGEARRRPGGSSRRGETRPGRGAGEAVETVVMLRKLARDPSLRATESGRLLLRMLLATEVGPAQWKEIAEAIPSHCMPLVRAVVLQRSEEWKQLASMVPAAFSA
ncbi:MULTISPECIES: ParB N-terminal domain-containing protein [Microbispora]|uniref:Winged helix-turn-helix transcriptional regulator n=1 Tax=Microbispora hainanensis TaxID=568844 RepID=A0ABZ1SRC1_9ACTN|nr:MULTISPECIES: ParB N-terminal domain-containing protein [Microbispora]